MSRTKKPVNPSAQKGLDRLKEETAAELGLNDYKNTYKGALTSADNGRVGGHMVRKMIESRETQFGQGNTQATGSTLTAKQDINKKS